MALRVHVCGAPPDRPTIAQLRNLLSCLRPSSGIAVPLTSPRPLPRAPVFRASLRPLGSADKAVLRGVRRRKGQAHADASHRASQHVPNPMYVVPMRHGQVVSDATQPSPRRGLVILESEAALAKMSRIASRLPPAGPGACCRPHHVSWFRHRRYTSVSGRRGAGSGVTVGSNAGRDRDGVVTFGAALGLR